MTSAPSTALPSSERHERSVFSKGPTIQEHATVGGVRRNYPSSIALAHLPQAWDQVIGDQHRALPFATCADGLLLPVLQRDALPGGAVSGQVPCQQDCCSAASPRHADGILVPNDASNAFLHLPAVASREGATPRSTARYKPSAVASKRKPSSRHGQRPLSRETVTHVRHNQALARGGGILRGVDIQRDMAESLRDDFEFSQHRKECTKRYSDQHRRRARRWKMRASQPTVEGAEVAHVTLPKHESVIRITTSSQQLRLSRLSASTVAPLRTKTLSVWGGNAMQAAAHRETARLFVGGERTDGIEMRKKPEDADEQDTDDSPDGESILSQLQKMGFRENKSARDARMARLDKASQKQAKLLKSLHMITEREEWLSVPKEERAWLQEIFTKHEKKATRSGTLNGSGVHQALVDLGLGGRTEEERRAVSILCHDAVLRQGVDFSRLVFEVVPDARRLLLDLQWPHHQKAFNEIAKNGTLTFEENLDLGLELGCHGTLDFEGVNQLREKLSATMKPWNYVVHSGKYSHGEDLYEAKMTVAEAKAMSLTLEDCQGFCHEGPPRETVAKIRFKSTHGHEKFYDSPDWTTYWRDEAPPPLNCEQFRDIVRAMAGLGPRLRCIRESEIVTNHGVSRELLRICRPELMSLYDTFACLGGSVSDRVHTAEVLRSFGLDPRQSESVEQVTRRFTLARPGFNDSTIDFPGFIILVAQIRKESIQQRSPELRAIFGKYDVDSSGELDIAEIIHFLTHLGFKPHSRKERDDIAQLLEQSDDNGNGLIDFEEFELLVQKLMEKRAAQTLKVAEQMGFERSEVHEFDTLFRELDTHHTGSLSGPEIQAGLGLLGHPITITGATMLFEIIDKERVGRCDFEGFLQILSMMKQREGMFAADPVTVFRIQDLSSDNLQEVSSALGCETDTTDMTHTELSKLTAEYLCVQLNVNLVRALNVSTFDELIYSITVKKAKDKGAAAQGLHRLARR